MLRLLNPANGPVGGYRFIDPDTNFVYSKAYKTFDELAAHVKVYRDQNKLLPIESFREVWENWICNQFGMEGKCCPVEADIQRSFEQYISGAKAYVRKLISNEKFVSKETAERRAATCVDCNQNLANIGHRMSQFYTDKFMMHQTGGKRTSHDDKLFTCKLCTCLIRSKIHYPSREIAASLTDTDIGRMSREPKSLRNGQPLRCWQLLALEESKK